MTPRHRRLLDHIRLHGDTSVEELAKLLEVTTQTIRRDIRELEDARLLARYHGGVGIPSTVENIDYDQRRAMDSDAKQRIGELAAAQVEPGRSLIINIGTTTEEVAKALQQHRGIRVVTNNLNVASTLSNCDEVEVIVAGGLVRKRDRGIVGEATIDFMRQFKVDIGIIGVSGIENDGTLLDYDYREVRVTQAIIEQSREVWLVADHTKFGRHALVRLGNISQIDKFITDLPVPPEAAEAFERAGVQVLVAGSGAA
jgi:DeoR family glycerol-3-phosphate regulon repressor